jgi:erythromycin esterase-like protein
MHRRTWTSRWSLRVLAPAIAMMVMFTAAPGARAEIQGPAVTGWLEANAVPLSTVDPAAPLTDLAPLRRSVGDAEIVGLGESVHGAAEELTLKHRTLRFLVERMGFRSIAWEDDWTVGLQVDEYIRTGSGDLDALMAQLTPQWQSREVADLLQWLHDYNTGRADKVRFVGVEFYLTPPRAYEAVTAYVAATTPHRLPELRRHLRVIQPPVPDRYANMYEYIQWFETVPDQSRYVRHAQQVHQLVASLPHRPGNTAHTLALRTARQIVSFYEHYRLPDEDSFAYRDAHAAQNLKWWRDRTGDKVVYWAASPHVANAPGLRIVVPPDPDMRFASAGSYLRRWYGNRYRTIGFTFDHGVVSLGPGQTVPMPPPAPDWFEQPFGNVRAEQFIVDLRAPAPPPVRKWLQAPVKTRGLPHRGPSSFIDGGQLGQWFDVIVHRQRVSPME